VAVTSATVLGQERDVGHAVRGSRPHPGREQQAYRHGRRARSQGGQQPAAAATAGPTVGSGSKPQPAPITIRETPITAMTANGTVSRALDRRGGRSLVGTFGARTWTLVLSLARWPEAVPVSGC
jgi:hypothetical protein